MAVRRLVPHDGAGGHLRRSGRLRFQGEGLGQDSPDGEGPTVRVLPLHHGPRRLGLPGAPVRDGVLVLLRHDEVEGRAGDGGQARGQAPGAQDTHQGRRQTGGQLQNHSQVQRSVGENGDFQYLIV